MRRGSTIWLLPVAVVGVATTFLGGYLWGEYRQTGGLRVVHSLKRLPLHIHAAMGQEVNTAELAPEDAFVTVLDHIRRSYYDRSKVSEEQLTYSGIRGLLASLGDQFTRFMDPKEYKQMQEDTRGDFVGIGAQLDTDPLGAVVKRPIPNSPAIRKGLRANDVIIRVDGKVVAGMDIDKIVRLIRGERGKPVTITVKRKDAPNPINFTIIRDIINTPNIEAFMEDNKTKIGRIWLGQFNEKAAEQIDEEWRKLDKQGIKGLVFDLRFNPGGLLTSAVQVASRFEKDGPVVIIQGKNGAQERLAPDLAAFHAHDYPIVVLVNGNSASASEIVSGCLKDYHRATLVGEKTFGKGLVQTVIQLPGNTAVAITTAKYLTPNGIDINRKRLPTGKMEGGGIQPDVEVKPGDDWTFTNKIHDLGDAQLQKALDVLRERIAAKEAHKVAHR